ncbi:MAG: ABC transporter permease [Acidobacteria bacterium]|nr:MAG: ABC transporter permease [Acidobacteriota bacterium]
MDFYVFLLRLYPRGFRERFGAGMRRAFAQDLAAATARGPFSRATFLAASAIHAVWFGTLERLPRGPVMRSFFQFDLRAASRSLRATPIVTAVALVSLALGIGANTALFSILNSLVLKPLPVRAPEELVRIDDGSWTNPIWEGIRNQAPTFTAGAFAWSATSFNLAKEGEVDRVDGAYASGDVFQTLGVTAAIGRLFTSADDTRAFGPDGPVAVLSYRLWQQRFGGDPSVIGRSLLIERHPFTVVGVMPSSFEGVDIGRVSDVIIPVSTDAWINGKDTALDSRTSWWLEIWMRLPSGKTIDEVTLALNAARPGIRDATLPKEWPAKFQDRYLKDPFKLVPSATGDSALRPRYAQPLTVILFVVGAVLVIACANIANLLLARATARRHEMSVRLALGASRARLARQLLAESLILATAGGLMGLAVAQFASRLLVGQLATSVSTVTLDLSPDWRMLAFTAAVSFGTAILFGLAPALGVSRVAPNEALREQSRSVTGDRRFGVRSALVIAQVALSLSLVVAAGLFMRSFVSLTTQPLGFDPSNLLVTTVDMRQSAATPAERRALYERIRDAVASVPGIRHSAISQITPVGGSSWNGQGKVEGGLEVSGKAAEYWVNPVSPGWFETYGMRLLAGRDVAATDTETAEQVVVVNETFAKRFIGGGNPIGRVMIADADFPEARRVRIVGLVSDAVYRNSRAGIYATAYFPFLQGGGVSSSFRISSNIATDRPSARRALASALTQVDGRLSYSFRDLSDQVRASMAQERLVAMLSGFFGALALLLAGIGLYGVTSYAVNQRRTEIAVRIALGATATSVVRMVLGRTGWLVATGVIIGAGLSYWAAKFVGALLFGLTPRDPMTLAMALVALASIGVLAAWLPARRAARMDPSSALRD